MLLVMCGVSGVVVALTAGGPPSGPADSAVAAAGVQLSVPAAGAPFPSSSTVVRRRRPKPAVASYTVTGQPADTRYGPVQVRLTLRQGLIIKADAIAFPSGGGRNREINSYAIPRLDVLTMRAQSAQIDTVSGATYTSGGYRTSLQSALDAAHRARLL